VIHPDVTLGHPAEYGYAQSKRRKMSMIQELSSHSDHELDEIGNRRAEIRAISRRASDKQH